MSSSFSSNLKKTLLFYFMAVDEIWKYDLLFCPHLHQARSQYSADFFSAGSSVKFLLYLFIKDFLPAISYPRTRYKTNPLMAFPCFIL